MIVGKKTIEFKAATNQTFSTNCTLRTHFRQYLSKNKLKERFSRECRLYILNYNLIISNPEPSSIVERHRRDEQGNMAQQKNMVNLAGTQQLDMCYWRRWTEGYNLSYGKL